MGGAPLPAYRADTPTNNPRSTTCLDETFGRSSFALTTTVRMMLSMDAPRPTTPTISAATTPDPDALIRAALETAVPLWVEVVRGYGPGEHAARARVCCDAVAHHGDVILYRGARRGQSSDAFNRLAEGVALLSFAPGGVTVFGLHFESVRSRTD